MDQTGAPIPDWTQPLQADERLLWSGRPDPSSLLVLGVIFLLFSIAIGPELLLLLLVPAVLYAIYGFEAYALSNQRILHRSHPPGRPIRVKSLPRAGTHVMPRWNRLGRALIFTAPDGSEIRFHFLSRADFSLLLKTYPSVGPQLGTQGTT